MAWLSDAGHEARYHPLRPGGPLPERGDAELMLIAGGDGTVSRTIRRLPDDSPAIAILPLGTANNVAVALGVRGSPRSIIRGLAASTVRPFDVGTISGNGTSERFVESAGLGVFARVLRDARREKATARRGVTERDLAWRPGDRLRRLMSREAPVRRRIVADDTDHSGRCLFVAVLNIPVIGPRLSLAPAADPSDGYLDLLVVRPDDRAPMDAYLEAIATQQDCPAFPLETIRCRRVELDWDVSSGHLDDLDWPGRNGEWTGAPLDGTPVTIGLRPALRVLLGDGASSNE
jgi:diacylglycerol kinase family enzyme